MSNIPNSSINIDLTLNLNNPNEILNQISDIKKKIEKQTKNTDLYCRLNLDTKSTQESITKSMSSFKKNLSKNVDISENFNDLLNIENSLSAIKQYKSALIDLLNFTKSNKITIVGDSNHPIGIEDKLNQLDKFSDSILKRFSELYNNPDYRNFFNGLTFDTSNEERFLESLNNSLKQMRPINNLSLGDIKALNIEYDNLMKKINSLNEFIINIKTNPENLKLLLSDLNEILDKINNINKIIVSVNTNHEMVKELLLQLNNVQNRINEINQLNLSFKSNLDILKPLISELADIENKITEINNLSLNVHTNDLKKNNVLNNSKKSTALNNGNNTVVSSNTREEYNRLSKINKKINKINQNPIKVDVVVDEQKMVALNRIQKTINKINSNQISIKENSANLNDLITKLNTIQSKINTINQNEIAINYNNFNDSDLTLKLEKVQTQINEINKKGIVIDVADKKINGLLNQLELIQTRINEVNSKSGFLSLENFQQLAIDQIPNLFNNISNFFSNFKPNIDTATISKAIDTLKFQIEKKLNDINLEFEVKPNPKSTSQPTQNFNSLSGNLEKYATEYLETYFEISKITANNNIVGETSTNNLKDLNNQLSITKNNLISCGEIGESVLNYIESLISKTSKVTSESQASIINSKLNNQLDDELVRKIYNKYNKYYTGTESNRVHEKESSNKSVESLANQIQMLKQNFIDFQNMINSFSVKNINKALNSTQKSIDALMARGLNNSDNSKNLDLSILSPSAKDSKSESKYPNIKNSQSLSENYLAAKSYIESYIKEIEKLKLELSSPNSNINKDLLTSNLNFNLTELNKILSVLENIKIVSEQIVADDKINIANSKIESKFSKLAEDVQKYTSQNGKAMANSTYKSQFENLINEINGSDSKNVETLTNLQTRFNNLKTEMTRLGKVGKSVGQEIDFIFSKIGLKAILGTMIYRVIDYFKEMLVTVKDVDTAMVSLKRVTSESTKSYDMFLSTATKNAKELASTVTDIINTASSWSRLGYNIDDATTLGALSTMYSNVGYIDVEQATDDLVSTMKAFDISADKAEHIVDVFNELGNKFALSSADVGSGLVQSASALEVAGNSFEESVAMIVGATEITQDSDSVGNALKTLSMRIRGAKADLESLGEDTDDLTDSTSKMRDEILAMSGVDIMLDDTTFKSTYQIMREIANVWDNLSDVNQAGLLDKLAGKTRANFYPYVEKSA